VIAAIISQIRAAWAEGWFGRGFVMGLGLMAAGALAALVALLLLLVLGVPALILLFGVDPNL
jgi:hypothetical protein